ncbi:MAG TPA: Hpt domain-containing protein, partial [Lysobacter sp.]|nr:Hpt domain-containing protein [Lysobacter sp.]
MTDGLLVLERNPTSAAELESCMRAAHSLKGAARIVGLTAAVAVAHAMEDCLVDAQHGRTTLGNAVIDVLLGGVDLLSRIADTPAADAAEWMQDDAPETDRFRAALIAALAVSQMSLSDAAPQSAVDSAPSETHETERVLRITASSLNRLLGLAGESLVESRWLDPFIRSLARVKQLQRHSAMTLDRFVEISPTLSSDQHAVELLAHARSTIGEAQRLFSDRVTQLDMFERRIASVSHRLYEEALASHM